MPETKCALPAGGGSKMADMSGPEPKGYGTLAHFRLDDDIVKAATEASNGKLDDATKRLSAEFEAAAAAVPPAWEIDEYIGIFGEYGSDC